VVYTEWIFFALMALGLFVLRHRADLARDYSAWGYPWAPVLFAAGALAVVLNEVASRPAETLTGLALVAAGLPVYSLWARRGLSRKVDP
jgi:APA family basic amino acid/polyamine antiporter